MSKLPPIPSEQKTLQAATHLGRRDAQAGPRQPGDSDVNLNERGRQANIRQNLTPQRSVQDR